MNVFDDDSDIFMDLDTFGETVVVMPDGQTEREVIAVVVRRPPRLDPNGRRTLEAQLQVRFANNATTGLALSELELGRTTVRLSPRLGQGAETYLAHMPEDGQPWQDAGMIRLWLK